MKISISETRRRLPELIRQVRKDAGTRIQITVHDDVVAELRAVQAEPEPGVAARRLLELRRRLARKGVAGRRSDVSNHVKEHLYGSKGIVR